MLINDTYLITSKNISPEELEKLKKLHIPIYFYDYDDGHYDEVGGYHDCAEGWNPNGVWCGECTSLSCAKCPSKDVKEGFYVAGKSSSSSGSRD